VKSVFLEASENANVEKINWQPGGPRFIAQKLAPVSNILAPVLDASQTMGGIPKLCRKLGLDILRVSIFPVEKANDQSLLELDRK
jgi:hypothetical protein